MVWILMLAVAAAAPAEPAPAPATPGDPAGWPEVLDAAADLGAAGEVEASRATLDLVLAQPVPDDVRARAEALRAELPMTRDQAAAMIELATVQALVGGYLLGPHMARLSFDPMRSATPYYLGAAGGVALGAGTAILLGVQPGFDRGESRAMVLGEVLGGATGVVVGFALDEFDETGPSIGVLAGVGAGAGLGWLATRLDPSPAAVRGAASGAVWGTGLAGAGLVWTRYGDERDDTVDKALITLAVGADAGAALGLVAQQRLGLTAGQLAYADLGMVLGSGVGLGVVGILAERGDVSPQTGTALVTVGGLGGGVLAGWLADPDAVADGRLKLGSALLSGRPGDFAWAVPVPTVTPEPDGAYYGVRLASGRF